MVRELRKEMEGSRDERETSLKSTLEENVCLVMVISSDLLL